MNRKQAEALADTLMGTVVDLKYWHPQSFTVKTERSVFVNLVDGRAVRLDVDAGSVYPSLADRESMENPDARMLAWDSSEDWARDLAFLIDGEAWQSGGNIWLVVYHRPDGKWACISSDGAGIYNIDPREAYDESAICFEYH